MSLHVLADHMASKGRNGDSMLVHMTPGEVAGLHALAMKHGGSLTINPDTGLPEASFLKSLLPMIAGFALGPAGFGLVSSAMGAGAVVGGLTGIATGSLSKGLMAGLGAYGGFGIGESLAGLGAAEMSQGAIQAQMPEFTGNVAEYADKVNALRAQTLSAANAPGAIPYMDKISAGFSSASASPMDALGFAKNNMMPLAAAAAPIAADMMVPTTTKVTPNTNPAYIRQYVAGDRPHAPRALEPVLAADWGARSFQDAYRAAEGGIVALAGGGVTDQQVVDWFKANPGAKDTDIAAAMQQYGVDPAQVARATGTEDKLADYEQRYVSATNQNVLDFADQAGGLSTATQGGTGTAGIADWMDKSGIDAQEYARALESRFGAPSAGSATNPYTAEGIQSLYDKATMVGNQADIINAASPIKDIHDTRNDKAWVDWMDTNKVGVSDAARAFGLSDAEVKERYDAVKKPAVKTKTPFVNPVTGGTINPPTRVTDTVLPTDPTVNAPPGTRNPYGGPNTPGDRTYNPDGSVTITPNIPGRPYGGFSGMDEVKNAYTKGGGSLGYTPYVPKTAAEHAKMYNTQTGDSLAAYNYLMGKGAYPTKSGVSEIMKPYEEAVLGYPTDITKKKYINVGGKMVLNPDYKAPVSKVPTSSDPNVPPTTAPTAGFQWGWNQKTKKWEEIPIAVSINEGGPGGGNAGSSGDGDGDGDGGGSTSAKRGGLLHYAQGGISGDGNLNLHIPLDFGGGGGGFGGGGGGIDLLGGDYGVDKPIPMASTGSTGGAVNPNTGTGGFGFPGDRPDETGGLYKGPMTMSAGLDDMMTPEIMAANAATQAKNQAAWANARANPASVSDLAKGLGLFANGGMTGYAVGGGLGSLGGYSDGGRLLKGPGDGVSDSIPATIGRKQQPARLADGEFVVPARIVSELGNGSTDAGARKLYAMMDRVQKARGKTTGKKRVATNTRADKYLPA